MSLTYGDGGDIEAAGPVNLWDSACSPNARSSEDQPCARVSW